MNYIDNNVANWHNDAFNDKKNDSADAMNRVRTIEFLGLTGAEGGS